MIRKAIIVTLTLGAVVAYTPCTMGIGIGNSGGSFWLALEAGLLDVTSGTLPGPYGWHLHTHPLMPDYSIVANRATLQGIEPRPWRREP